MTQNEHEPVEEHEAQDRRLNATLLQIRLLSTVGAMSFSSGGGGHADSAPPAGEKDIATAGLIRRYHRAESDGAREKVIAAAQAELESARKRDAPPPPASISITQLVLDDGATF